MRYPVSAIRWRNPTIPKTIFCGQYYSWKKYLLTCVAYTNCFSLIPSENFMATSSVGSTFYFTARSINFVIYLKRKKNSLNDWNLELHFVIWREKFARVFVHPPEVELFTYRTSGASNNNTAFISINWLFNTKLIISRCSGLMQGWFTSGITLDLKRKKIVNDWILNCILWLQMLA